MAKLLLQQFNNITIEQYMPMSPAQETAYLLALRFLQFRPRSVKEIREYLTKKQVTRENIEKVITKLLEQKFLDDKTFAELWVKNRITLKPLSQRVLRLELHEKGVTKDIIDEVLSAQEEISGSDEEMVRILVQKRKKRYEGLSKQDVYAKLGGFLGRKGFSYEISKRVIDDIFAF